MNPHKFPGTLSWGQHRYNHANLKINLFIRILTKKVQIHPVNIRAMTGVPEL